MIETIIVSCIVAAITSRITCTLCLISMDKHADDLTETTKGFFKDLLAILDKRI